MSTVAAGEPMRNEKPAARVDFWLVASLAAVAVLAIFTLWNSATIDHDCALYLQTGQLLLDGQVPYVDFVELNPPLIMYLSVIPAWVSRMSGLPAAPVFHVMCCLLIAVTLVQIRSLLRRSADYAPWEIGWVLGAWVTASIVVYIHSFFGQREHLFTLLYFPFLVMRVGRFFGFSASIRMASVVGIQAGIGCCIKPHFLVIACAVELALLLKHRRLRELWSSEVAMFWLTAAAYVAHWFFVPHAMFDNFFHRWFPLISNGYDEVYGIGVVNAIRSLPDGRWSKVQLAIVGVGLLLGIVGRGSRRDFLYAVSIFCVAAMAMFVAQRKGWEYHRIPIKMGAVVAAALIPMELRRLLLARGKWNAAFDRPAAVGGCLLFIPFLGLTLSAMRSQALRDEPEEDAALAKVVAAQTDSHDKVLVVSTSVKAYPVLLTLDRRPGSRYLWSFPIALFYRDAPRTSATRPFPYHDPTEKSPEEKLFLQETREDIAARRPELILIQNDDGPRGCPPTFNVHEYLEKAGVIRFILEAYQALPVSAVPKGYAGYRLKS
jgi:hypothetical protein